MENNIITINNSTRRVHPSRDFIGVSGENEYEKLIFQFDEFIDGTGLIEIDFEYIHHYEYILAGTESGTYEINGYTFTMPTISANDKLYFYSEEPLLQLVHNQTTTEITLTAGTSTNKLTVTPVQKVFFDLTKTDETYTFDIKSSLLRKAGEINMSVRVYDSDGVVFKSEKFPMEIKETINATSTIPAQYKEWIDRLIPSGGTTGQVLKKKSNIDYDTEWADETGGGGSVLPTYPTFDATKKYMLALKPNQAETAYELKWVEITTGTESQLVTSDGKIFLTSDGNNFIVKEEL